MDETDESVVKYSLNGEQHSANGDSQLFIDGGKKQHRQYIHKVSIIRYSHFCINHIF